VAICRFQIKSIYHQSPGIGTRNIQVYVTMHGIPPYADQKDKKSLKKSLPRKLESLWELVSSCSLQLIALQECPGRAMGFKKDDHVEELLRSVATALPNDPLHGWKILMFGLPTYR